MAQLNFDATQVSPDMGFDTVPAGWYNALIDESDMKPTKGGDGAYLHVRFNVIDGQYAGRKIFTRLNIRNANPVAQEIAYKQLSAIAHAVGVLNIQDSSQLHGIPLKIKVKVKKDTTGQYDDQNEINAFKNINEQVDMGTVKGPVTAPAGFTAAAPVQAAPMQFQQPMVQSSPQAWQPVAQPPQVAQPVPAQPWQQPAAAQPWQQVPAQQQPPAQAAPKMTQQPHPAQSAVPPWAQPQQ